jgi:hypothetical protein
MVRPNDLTVSNGLNVDGHDPKALARMGHTEEIARDKDFLNVEFMSGIDLAKPPTTLIDVSRPQQSPGR